MDRAREALDDPFAFLYSHDAGDGRRLKAALLAAALAHAGLLLVVFPATPRAAEPPPKARAHYILETYRPPRPEPPPPAEPRTDPLRERKRVPMPTPPDAPQPVVEPAELLPIVLPARLDALPVALPAVSIPAPPPATPAPEPIRVSGAEAPKRIHFVQPRYTELARRARIEGTVILDAIIGASGDVEAVVALRALTLGLTEAAIEAVSQWRYEPPRVDGRAVPVRMTVTVRYSLE